MNAVLKFIGLMVLILMASIIRGFVFSKLWFWFLVPLGLPAISIPIAMGISLIIGYLWYSYADADSAKTKDIYDLVGSMLVLPFGILLVGYIITLFI